MTIYDFFYQTFSVRMRFLKTIAFALLITLLGCQEKPAPPPQQPPKEQARAIAHAYHGSLLDKDLKLLNNVPPDEATAYYRQHGWPPIFADEKEGPPAKPVNKPKGQPEPPKGTYMHDCWEAGVPLPPPWGDKRWKSKGKLTKVFALPQYTAEVYVYESTDPLGICYALPRRDAKGVIQALGIICQGRKSSKACFWDNKKPNTNPAVPITGDDTKGMDPAKIADGSNLVENCTDCHRGDNVFIIVPDTPLEPNDPKKTSVDNPPYTPVGKRKGWENPQKDYGLKKDKDKKKMQCLRCHSIPELSDSYCRVMKEMVEENWMPPAGYDVKDFAEDIAKLKAGCNALPPPSSRWP
jgi:hypothetical protein